MSVVTSQAPSRRWRPSPAIAGSIGLHGLAAASVAIEGDMLPYALGAIVANHAFLTALGMWPRSVLLGPNITRLPAAAVARREVCLTFDDGPDPHLTPAVLDILDAHLARATFFCIAESAQRHPQLVREIVRRGHAVENHSRSHRATFAFHGLAGIRHEIATAQEAIQSIAGRPPRFFRPPAGIRNPLLDPVLHETGLRLATWTRRGYDTLDPDARRVAARLVGALAAGDILVLHDGHCARGRSGRPVALEALEIVLAAIGAHGLSPVTLAQAVDG